MQSNNSEAQVTQEGQAISINNTVCKQLEELFSSMLGPHGSLKALLNGGNQLNLTKDGIAICKEIPFTHPTAVLITRAADSMFESTGDGIISFVLLTTGTFLESFKLYCDGSSIPNIINSLQLSLNDISQYLRSKIFPLSDESLKGLIYSSFRTKVRKPDFLVDIILKTVLNLSSNKSFDTNMVEIMKMEGGDLRDSIFVDGLVLDHAGRHEGMPKELKDVYVMITNMSLEYEKPEINAEFCYSSTAQREALASTEREFISAKARAIADFANSLKKDGKTLLLVNEKGIDPFSLEILASAGILALRRAKRRNLERISKICGGTIITQIEQISKDALGFCQRVHVKEIGEEKYTFIEGVPTAGACTILIRGQVDYSRIAKSIKGTLSSVNLALQKKFCIRGGMHLYKEIVEMLSKKSKEVNPADSIGYKILSNVFENFLKMLLRNSGKNVQEGLADLFINGDKETVIENVAVIGTVISNSIYTAISLLMCDEIIKAGKSMKEVNKE